MNFPTIERLEARIAPASLSIADVQTVEGNSGTHTVNVTATLSAAVSTNVTFTLSTKNGTATAGSDYVANTQALTIPAGQTSVTFPVTINGDTVFEPTEFLFVNLTNASSNVTVINTEHVDPTAQATARVYILNDDVQNLGLRKAQWIDVDGDLVTMTVSKGSLPLTNTTLFTFDTTTSTVGGRILQELDLSDFGNSFANTNITITATKQPGFPGTSDGRVDVGYIQAATFIPSELEVIGIDLGTVTIDGDLAKITAGDQFSTPAITKLDVYSLGTKTSTLIPDPTATATTLQTQSDVLGPIGTLDVKTNVGGFLHVVGSEFGTIGTVKVGGSLLGGAPDNSGRISASGRIANATIGSIVGGSGAASGFLSGTAQTGGKLGNVTVLGDVTGGTGVNSGEIFSAGSIGAINISGKLAGNALSTATDSGSIQSTGDIGSLTVGSIIGGAAQGSGSVRAGVDDLDNVTALTGKIGAVKITGKDSSNDSLKGGSGVNSGRIDALGSILSFTSAGDIQGSAASGTGEILSRSTIGAIKIGGTITGDAGADSGSIQSGGNIASLSATGLLGGIGQGSGAIRVGVDDTGAVKTAGANIGAVTIGAAAATGDNFKGNTGVNSGQLDVAGNIASFTANGNVHGSTGNGSGAIIAGGAINTLVITGSLLGADSGAAALSTSGAIKAAWLKSVAITGDIVAGKKAGAGTITSSGAILANRIDLLTVGGKLTGDTTNPVFIDATGSLGNLAIKSLTVTGAVTYANIRAGYNETAAVSADASIGTVTFGSTVHALNLVAGAQPGTDGSFGTADDIVATGTGVTNSAAVISQIASVIFKSATAIVADSAKYGISAQLVTAITLGSTKIALHPGPDNDRTPITIGTATNFAVVELPAT